MNENFWNGFEKQAKLFSDDDSVAGTIVGGAGGDLLAGKYVKSLRPLLNKLPGKHTSTAVAGLLAGTITGAGAVVGARAGGKLKSKDSNGKTK